MQVNDMKLPAILLSTLFIAAPAYAGGPATGYRYNDPSRDGARVFPESHCYRNTEEYVPGYYDSRGQYVGGYIKHNRTKVSCGHHHRPTRYHRPSYHQPSAPVDNNDCSGGTVAGALIGGGLAGYGSRGKGRWWAIPAGIVGGAMLGCQISGG